MKIEYKKEITAFIDVLGFSEIVFAGNNSLIESYFSYINLNLKELTKLQGIRHYYISDTIILTAPDSFDNFLKVLIVIQKLQSFLIKKKILVRGGVTIDDIYLNKSNNIIVGPSLINAYKLEGMAKFPRIIVDRQIINHYNYNNTNIFLSIVNDHIPNKKPFYVLKVDEDNLLYINYMAAFCDSRQNYMTLEGDAFNSLYELIQKSFLGNQHLEKYDWLKLKTVQELNYQKEYLEGIPRLTIKKRDYHKRRKIRGVLYWLEKFGQL